jgi:hypothetical protein
MSNNPMMLPSTLLWNLPKGIDFLELVTRTVKNIEFVHLAWPTLSILMGDNILNFQWASSVYITLAVFSVLSALGEKATRKE